MKAGRNSIIRASNIRAIHVPALRRRQNSYRYPNRFPSFLVPAVICCMALLFCACGSLSTDHLLPKLPGGDSVLQGKDSELANVFSALIEVGETEDPYSVIYSALSNYEKEITIKNTDAEQIKKAFLAVLSDHPELFWVANGYSSSGYSLGAASVVTLVPIISDGLEEILQKQQELQDTVNRILWQIPKDASDYEKALFLHDWLVQTTEYDLEAYKLLLSPPDSSSWRHCLWLPCAA